MGPVRAPPRVRRRHRPPRRGVGRVHAADGRDDPVLPSALRGADDQAAAPRRGRGLPRRDAREPEQPRARRQPGDEPDGGRGRRGARADVRPRAPVARAPDVERDDREPRGAVGRPRAASGQGDRALLRRALHARAHVPGARRRGARGSRAARRPRRPRRDRGAGADGGGRHRRPHGGDDRRRRGRPDPRGARLARALRRAHPRRRRLRRVLHAAGRDRPGPRGAVPRDRGLRLGRRRSAQARAAALRLRRGASSPTRASGGSTSTTRRTRTSRPTSCTWGRSASSARGRAPRPARCG